MYKKRKWCMLLLSVCMFLMTACGKKDIADNSDTVAVSVQDETNNETTDEEENEINGEESLEEENRISMDDIVWEVDEGIIDGERLVLLNYTNNTPYTIAGFEITFKEKSDITEGEKRLIVTNFKKNFPQRMMKWKS